MDTLVGENECGAARPTIAPARDEAAKSNGDHRESDVLINALTKFTWARSRPGSETSSELMVWKFDRQGGFSRKFTSDYAETYSGAWALSQATPNSGIVFLA